MTNTELFKTIIDLFTVDINNAEKPLDFFASVYKGFKEGELIGYEKGKEDGYSEGYNDGLNEKNY